MKKYFRFFKVTLSALLCFAMAGCIEESYDLENIDMTIGANVDLTLPSSSTGEITLKNIMDLEDDGIVQVIDGDFYIQENGAADIPEIKIEAVKIKSPKLDRIEADVLLNVDAENIPSGQSGKSMAPRRVNIGGVEIPDREFKYTIKDMSKTSFEFNTISDPITSDVVALKEVKFKDETTLVIDIMTKLGNNGEFFKLVHLDDLFVKYPKGLNIKKVTCEHWSFREDGTEYLNVHEAANIDNENGILDLTDGGNVEIGEMELGVYRSIKVKVEFDKAFFNGDNDLKFNENNQIALQGLFQMGGTFRVETADLLLLEKIYSDENERKEIITKLIMKYMTGGGINAIIPDKISFTGEARFRNDYIEVEGAKAKVVREVSGINPIKLDNLPDFLNDPEVVLDLANPIIYVDVDNTLPAAAYTEITMRSLYDDSAEPDSIKTGKITVPAEKRTIFCLCLPGRFSDDMKHPEEYEQLKANIEPLYVENLNKLLKYVPKEIKVEVAPIQMELENNYLNIPSSYDVAVKYKIFTPLDFGSEFRLVYQDTESGWAEEIGEDFKEMDAQEIALSADVVSSLPLNLSFTVDLLNEKGTVLEGLIVDQLETIEANSKGTPVSFSIKPAKGHTIKEFLSGEKGQKLDGVRYKAVASAKNGGALKETASIKLKNIKVRLKGSVSYDAN